ncbi:MAG: membrane dipeptidase [Roseiflexaceae bacterium]|nr:membrane dipeptidase [Roseiflexaceae bacterium]
MIIDAHLDIASNALSLGRNYDSPVAEIRRRENPRADDIATVGLAEALAGDVALVFGTLFVAPESGSNISPIVYSTPEQAHQQALDQLHYYQALVARAPVRLIKCQRDLAQLLDDRAAGQQVQGLVMLMEGADPILHPEQVHEWRDWGVRIVGPAWKRTRYCGGTGAPGPLSSDGRALMREMSRAQVALDVSHMAEESFWQALDLFEGSVIASHSNCRALFAAFRLDRQLSDRMLRALIERDAVVGAVLYNKFLVDGWTPQEGKQAVGLDAVVRHIDHICQLAGSARHCGIGSDFDGGFGTEAIPREFDTIADLHRLADALATHGYSETDIAGIMGGNWLRKLGDIIPG